MEAPWNRQFFRIDLTLGHCRCLKLALLLLFAFPAFAQQLPFAHLSISEGLEDTVIFAMEQAIARPWDLGRILTEPDQAVGECLLERVTVA